MKILAVAVLALLAGAPGVRFEGEGVRIGNLLVQGAVLELQGSGAIPLLASGSTIEALGPGLVVELAPGRLLTLEPGVRVTREDGGFRLAAHGQRPIRFSADGGTFAGASPQRVVVTDGGWRIGDRSLSGSGLLAGLSAQEDTDANLDRMKRSSDRLRNENGVPKLSSRKVRLFWGDPLRSGQAAGSIGIRQIPRVSPSGGP